MAGLAGSFPPAAAVVQTDGPLREKRPWRGAGVAVPVFSLRSQSSVGAGEFVDIRALVDLCAAAGDCSSLQNMWLEHHPCAFNFEWNVLASYSTSRGTSRTGLVVEVIAL